MRFVLAAALAMSVAGAAFAAPVKVEKAPAQITKQVSTTHCWICHPADRK